MRSSRLFWAIILLGGGSLLLLNNLNIIDINFGILFAFFLILLGVFTMFIRRDSSEGSESQVSVSREGVSSASLHFEHGAGQLLISGGADKDKVISGTAGGGVKAKTNYSQDHLRAKVSASGEDFFLWALPWNWGGARTWNLHLTPDIPLDVHVEAGATENRLDLKDLQVRDLHIETGASSTDVTLPANAGMTHVKVESGAASVNIRVPDGVAARIETEAFAAGVDIDNQRFPKNGSVNTSPDYAEADNKVDIRISTGVGSVKIY
ncbi:MAG: hypothetical protein HND51_04865 [Chloroflexi bacterium]|nr:hypothetical protein [Chloroflexota bacterium]